MGFTLNLDNLRRSQFSASGLEQAFTKSTTAAHVYANTKRRSMKKMSSVKALTGPGDYGVSGPSS